MIYFDNNATTRVLDEVADIMRPYLTENFANPASAIGQFEGLSRVIASAKATIAEIIGADDGEQIVITSGATEANNLALLGAARANTKRRHIIASAIEHPSVLEVLKFLESTGYRLTLLPVGRDGVVRPVDVQAALSADTLLVSIMLANNETGVIQPVGEIASLVKDRDSDVLIHTDATQAVGKIAVDLADKLGAVDVLSFSAHKFHGPKGVGALFIRDIRHIAPISFGGGQQLGLRPGTENPAALVGMAAALRALTSADDRFRKVEELRDDIQQRISLFHSGAFALGITASRLPNTLSLCLPGVDGGDLVDRMAATGIAISTGSACAHGANSPSYVVTAMGLSHDQAQCCIRVSLSIETTQEEVDQFVDAVAEVVRSPVKANTGT